jgi:hypothetical protein
MALSFEADIETSTIRFVARGGVEYEPGLMVLERGIAEAVRLDPARKWHLLFDVRESSENRSGDELRVIAGVIISHKQSLSLKCVLLAADALHYGLSRMFGAYLENDSFEINVFAEMRDAEAWLRGAGATERQ